MDRTGQIVITGVVGIVVNILLAGFKYFVGVITHSVAITADAVNNFSDALSSLITILGAKLASKEPDRKHPFGYGRIEHLSTLFIALLILYAGLSALRESVMAFFEGGTTEYDTTSLIIVGVALVVKFLLAAFTKSRGKKYDSSSLIASGQDAFNDCLLSAATIISALVFIYFGLSIEKFIGIIISILILKAGVETMKETVSVILGERISPELSVQVKGVVNSFDKVMSANDLVINSYGAEKLIGSVHITVPDSMKADELDALERQITDKVFEETGVILTGISVYSFNTADEFAAKAIAKVRLIMQGFPETLGMHGFYIDAESKDIRFDVVFDFETPNKGNTLKAIKEAVLAEFPGYDVGITLDYNISD